MTSRPLYALRILICHPLFTRLLPPVVYSRTCVKISNFCGSKRKTSHAFRGRCLASPRFRNIPKYWSHCASNVRFFFLFFFFLIFWRLSVSKVCLGIAIMFDEALTAADAAVFKVISAPRARPVKYLSIFALRTTASIIWAGYDKIFDFIASSISCPPLFSRKLIECRLNAARFKCPARKSFRESFEHFCNWTLLPRRACSILFAGKNSETLVFMRARFNFAFPRSVSLSLSLSLSGRRRASPRQSSKTTRLA